MVNDPRRVELDQQPLAVLTNGTEVTLRANITLKTDGNAVRWSAVLCDPLDHPVRIDRVRLFDIELPGQAYRLFTGGFYMPSDAAEYLTLRVGQTAPASSAWSPTWLTPTQCAAHTMVCVDSLDAPNHRLLGFTTFQSWHGYFVFDVSPSSIRCSAWCDLEGTMLAPGQSVELEKVLVLLYSDQAQALDAYAQTLAAAESARVPARTITGWIDWQYYREEKSEADIFRSVEAMKTLRARGYPLEYVIIDGGWCDHASEWLEPCEKFLSGMKDISRRLHDDGFKFGLWLAPWITNVNTRVVREHPEWLVQDLNSARPLYRERSNVGPCHVIDYSLPEARRWLGEIVGTMVHDWGVDYLKLDGPCLAHFNGGAFHDRAATRTQVIHRSLQAIRQAAGEQVLIEGEGIYGPSIGLVDLQRVTQDSSTHWYFPDGRPLAKANLQHDLLSGWMHRRLWANHRENIILRDFRSPFHAGRAQYPQSNEPVLTENQMRTQLSATALAGGAQLLSDPVEQLLRSPPALARLSQLLPPVETTGCAPIDLGDGTTPAAYYLRVDRPFETWYVLGVFNWTDQFQDFRIPLSFCGADRWHAHEFWSNTYYGVHESELVVPDVPADGCRLFALRRQLPHPQLVGTDIHLFQGAAELESLRFEGDTLDFAIHHFNQRERTLTLWHPDDFLLETMGTDALDHLVDARQPNLLKIHYNGNNRAAFTLKWRHKEQ